MEAAVLNLGAESRSSTEENIHFIFFFAPHVNSSFSTF